MPNSRIAAVLAAGAFLGFCGCPPRSRPMLEPPPPVPMQQAVEIVNRNIQRIRGTLRASGSVDGYFTTQEGRRIHYDLDGIFFYLAPTHVRFDLKKLGARQFLFGCNEQMYWVYDEQKGVYHCGRRGLAERGGELPLDVPARPEQIPDALGLAPVPSREAVGSVERVQRVVDEHQQILFLLHDDQGRLIIEKEYWLDRFPPQLIRRVVFRDGKGVAKMISVLDDYRPLSPGGPSLPHEMTAEWPQSGAQMRFRVRKWEPVPQIGPTGPQFATPTECASTRPGA